MLSCLDKQCCRAFLYRLGIVGAAYVHSYRIIGKTLAERINALHNLVNGAEYLLIKRRIPRAELLITAHVAPPATQPCLKIKVFLLQGSDKLLVYPGIENNTLKRLWYPEVAPARPVVDEKIQSARLTQGKERTVNGFEDVAERGIQRPVAKPNDLHSAAYGAAQIVCRHNGTHSVGQSSGRYQQQTGFIHNGDTYLTESRNVHHHDTPEYSRMLKNQCKDMQNNTQ